AAMRSRVMAKFMSAISPAAIPTSSACRSPRPACCSSPPDIQLPEWFSERGIGEIRYALIDEGAIVEARVELDDIRRAGSAVAARVVTAAPRNAVARDEQGVEYLLPRGSGWVTEGAPLTIEITREAIPGKEPWKRPLGR